jgi:hypothetical protein
MKASALAGHSFLKALIYGDSGAGKTCLAAQAPGPIEYWDFDGKLSSAVSYFKRTGQTALLDQIDVHQFGSLPMLERIPAWEKRTQELDKLIKAKQPFPFKTIVIDSITTLSHHLMEDYIFRSQTGLKRPLPGVNGLQDYSLYEKHMTRVLSGILAQPLNFIVLGHVDIDKDENTGMITRKPLCAGQQLAKKLPIWFEEVYVAKVMSDGKRVLQTQPDATYTIVRTQKGLSKEVPMEMKALLA